MNNKSRVQKVFTKPSLTRQEFKSECDLAMIVKRFSRDPSGQQHLANLSGFVDGLRFADVSSVPDFRSSRDLVLEANQRFMQLPAAIRKNFDNDPASFLDFVANPANKSTLQQWGLIPADSTSPVVADAQSGELSNNVQ